MSLKDKYYKVLMIMLFDGIFLVHHFESIEKIFFIYRIELPYHIHVESLSEAARTDYELYISIGIVSIFYQ